MPAPRTGSRAAPRRAGAAVAPRTRASPRTPPGPRTRPPPRRSWAAPLLGTALTALSVGVAWWFWSRTPPVPATLPAEVHAPAAVPAPAASRPQVGQASVAQLLQAEPVPDWRVARLQGNPAVMVIEFPGLLAQGQAMNRIAALLEKKGASRERVLDDTELAALIRSTGDNAATFYLGHDYRTEGLARFFNLAHAQGIALAAPEQRLRQLLLDTGMLADDGAGAAPALRAAGPEAVVSFSAVQADDPGTVPDERMDAQRRASVLRHELSHGDFFTRPTYRAHCWRFWRQLSDGQRAAWRRYLHGLGYDTADEELMVNETQALLMHTPDARDFNAAALGVSAAELEALRLRFQLAAP